MDNRQDFRALDALTMDDVYSPAYTEHMARIRREAALVLSRIALKHVFDEGVATHDPEAKPPTGVIERQPFYFRKRLIEYLHDRGDLLKEGNTYRPTDQLVQRATTPEEQYFGLDRPGTPRSPTLRAMKRIESIAGGVLQGRDGLALLQEQLGTEETWRTWQYLMVDAPPKHSCNSLVARALDLRLKVGEPTVVFEGGAGLGATLREALRIRGFRDRAANIVSYGFTDIDRSLMRRAKEMVREEAPEVLDRMHFDRVDLDELDDYPDLAYLRDGSVDIVILESVLHDVENLRQTLRSCHRILKPGGWLTFTIGSRGRPGQFFPCELLQSTLHSYYRAELDPPRRAHVGYLSVEEWDASLRDAGFPEFRIYPDPEFHERWPYGGIIAHRP